MNNEIKEIKINTLGQLLDFVETEEKAKLLIDYITNLQQKNKELNKENEKWYAVAKDFEMEAHDLWNKNNELEQENERLKELSYHLCLYSSEETLLKQIDDYKSRIEKAVEYLKEHTTSFGDVFIPASESWYLSDILNGKE